MPEPWTNIQLKRKPALEVSRADLKRSLQLLALGATRSRAHAIWSFGDGQLTIEIAGTSSSIPAAGFWPGRARVTSVVLRRIHTVLPEVEPIWISHSGTKLSINSFSVASAWQDLWPSQVIVVPEGASDAQLAALAVRFTQADLVSSGLEEVAAQGTRLRQNCTLGALHELEGMGVQFHELEALAVKSLERIGDKTWPRS